MQHANRINLTTRLMVVAKISDRSEKSLQSVRSKSRPSPGQWPPKRNCLAEAMCEEYAII
jgi:hypothetical protein